jgi:hypothetical protein
MAIHCLHPRHHQLAQLIEVACLGPDDDVVGAGDGLGLLDAVMSTISAVTLAALPTSVWMRMYAVTTGTDLLASSRPAPRRDLCRRDGGMHRPGHAITWQQVHRWLDRRGAAECRDLNPTSPSLRAQECPSQCPDLLVYRNSVRRRPGGSGP